MSKLPDAATSREYRWRHRDVERQHNIEHRIQTTIEIEVSCRGKNFRSSTNPTRHSNHRVDPIEQPGGIIYRLYNTTSCHALIIMDNASVLSFVASWQETLHDEHL